MSQTSLPFDEPGKAEKGYTHLSIQTNLIEYSAEYILNQFKDQLPDLSHVHILLSNNNAVSTYRSTLLKKAEAKGYPALLGPAILSLDSWVNQQATASTDIITDHARELLLVGALREHPDIYKHSSPWALAESLMELFDELTLAKIELPADINEFRDKIVDAYGSTQEVNETLGKEALLVHTLWFAMHQQLSELNCVDRASAGLLKLANSTLHLPEHHKVFYCGLNYSMAAESQWRNHLIERNQLQLFVHDHNHLNSQSGNKGNAELIDNYIRFFDLAYDQDNANFYDRSQQCKQLFKDSPVQQLIRVYSPESTEDEALGIDIQIRKWLLEGKRNIGIVTENRKLARRVRALLERANVKIDDQAGWALSTTSAATAIERLLETIEQDFHYQALLDLLKSPFVLNNDEEFLETIFQFEQHIVIGENTPSDISRYLRHIESRKSRLKPAIYKVNYDNITGLLNIVNDATKSLRELFTDNKELPATVFIDRLLATLTALNITELFLDDAAGCQLLSELDEMKAAATMIHTKMNWVVFRSWLGKTLERFNFKPETQSSAVKLITLSNSQYFEFDACIIAGAEQGSFPNAGKQSPFFNDSVRASLGIPTQSDRHVENYYYYRRLLCAVRQDDSSHGEILITNRSKENGEEIIASPWIASLQAFHTQCYGNGLQDSLLPQLVADTANQVQLDEAPLPDPVTSNPVTQIPQKLLPPGLSATDYQQLIDCPYQFFASRCLDLAAPDVVKEALQKSDYGSRVHRCLEAFHSNVEELPGPFKEKISRNNRQDAIDLSHEIAARVFADDIEDNFLHRGWLNRWQKMIPLYIDWQSWQQTEFTPVATEIKIDDVSLTGNISLRGRIDRIDQHQDKLAVIDYKTGRIPSEEDVLAGEATQLPFYLMLLMAENESRFAQSLNPDSDLVSAFYVDLFNTNKVSAKTIIQSSALMHLVDKNRHRLIEVMNQLREGYEAPAWGSVDICKHCQMDVLCRKQSWDTT